MSFLKSLIDRLRPKAPHPDTLTPEQFLKKGYELAYSMLENQGVLSPFGLGSSPEGVPTCILPEDGSPETVKRELTKGVDAGSFVEVLFFCEVHPVGATSRAIALYVDSPGAKSRCRLILTPFEFENGALVIGSPSVQESPDRILKA